MPTFYREIDVLIMPSVHESFCLTSVEAQSWGVPVIVSRVDGLPETIIEGETGLSIVPTEPIDEALRQRWQCGRLPEVVVEPGSQRLVPPRLLAPDLVADSVEQLVQSAEVYAAFSARASAHALKHFPWSTYAERMQQVLTRLAIGNRGRLTTLAMGSTDAAR
jgi:glycosyltransferase involved in cell wall biosynthesis